MELFTLTTSTLTNLSEYKKEGTEFQSLFYYIFYSNFKLFKTIYIKLAF